VGPLSGGDPPEGFRGFGGVVNVPANGAANRMALLTPPWSVREFLGARDFDVVHIHEPLVPLLPYYALWFSPRAAHVCTFHMFNENKGRAWRATRRFLAGRILRRFERAIAVSAPAADCAARYWKRPLSVIPNGVPTRVFRPPQPGPAKSADEPCRLLFVGNWRDPRKGLAYLLEAYQRLRAGGVSVRLDVIGQGDGVPRDDEGVVFHGPVADESALAEHYRRCDLFVSPATGQEAFGIVLLEAMACARPVICSDIHGYRQVVEPDGARFVPPRSAEALAREIADLAGKPEVRRRMGAANRARAEAYDWDRLVGAIREEYLAAVAARRGRLHSRDRAPEPSR
jgi:phosphatidylinositol alpha-mannosyltransferase